MNVITKKSLASEAVRRWAKQYMVDGEFVRPEYVDSRFSDKGEIYRKLVALGPDPDSDDVDNVIGNTSWTRLTCGECGTEVDSVIAVGEHVEYEINSVYLCWDCLKAAHSMLDHDNN